MGRKFNFKKVNYFVRSPVGNVPPGNYIEGFLFLEGMDPEFDHNIILLLAPDESEQDCLVICRKNSKNSYEEVDERSFCNLAPDWYNKLGIEKPGFKNPTRRDILYKKKKLMDSYKEFLDNLDTEELMKVPHAAPTKPVK
jgi:hypothetical protein